MASILEMFQNFLCYGNSECLQEFNSFSFNAMEGIFYLVFFPIVFIVVFIYMLSNKLFAHHRGLRLLIALAFFALIILQGWYYYFMQIGKLWYFGLIILGFFWLLLYGLRGGIGGQGRARSGDKGSFLGINFSKAILDKALGTTGVQLETLESDLNTLASTPPGAHGIDEITARINGNLLELKGNPAKYGLDKGKIDAIMKRYKKLCKEKGVKGPPK